MLIMATHESITTAEQLFNAPDLGRCELLRGELKMMSPAGSRHGWVVMYLTLKIGDFVTDHHLGVVFGAETGFLIGRNPDTVRAPDVAFVTVARVPEELPEGFFPGPPDLALEVLSPGDRASEVLAKVQDWLQTGACAVWVVDPNSKTVTVYHDRQKITILSAGDELTGGDLLPGFRLAVADLFGPR
jgi:Uma2 family endonuclease